MNTTNRTFSGILFERRVRLCCILLLVFLRSTSASSQMVYNFSADLSGQPHVISIQGLMEPGYIRAIDVEEASESDDTVRVRIFFKLCYPVMNFWIYDTTFHIYSDFPYNICIFGYRDSSSISTPACYYAYPEIIPLDTFCISPSQILGTNQVANITPLKLYPNPLSDKLYFETRASWNHAMIFSIQGREELSIRTEEFRGHISVAELPSGMYILMLYDAEGRSLGRARFVKQP